MKHPWLILCAVWLTAVAIPCRAQSPADGAHPPLVLVYVELYGGNPAPRIALGLEKPALKIEAFESYASISTANTNLAGLALKLKPDDAKALVAAMKALAAPGATTLPHVVLWYAQPDNSVLDFADTLNSESNIVDSGVLDLDSNQHTTIEYLLTRLNAH